MKVRCERRMLWVFFLIISGNLVAPRKPLFFLWPSNQKYIISGLSLFLNGSVLWLFWTVLFISPFIMLLSLKKTFILKCLLARGAFTQGNRSFPPSVILRPYVTGSLMNCRQFAALISAGRVVKQLHKSQKARFLWTCHPYTDQSVSLEMSEKVRWGDVGVRHLTVLHCTALCRHCILHGLKACDNPVLSKTVTTISPTTFAHFVSHFRNSRNTASFFHYCYICDNDL